VLELVAVVEHVGLDVSLPTPSPFTKPVYKGVMDGGVPPYVNDALDAVTLRDAGLTVTVPPV